MEKCASLDLISKDERAQIQQIIDEYIAENPHLYNNKHIEYLLCGVASHHAGLLPAWKNLVEKLFQKGLIKVVFATETLAAGINMPARSTVISSTSKRTDSGHRMLTASEFCKCRDVRDAGEWMKSDMLQLSAPNSKLRKKSQNLC